MRGTLSINNDGKAITDCPSSLKEWARNEPLTLCRIEHCYVVIVDNNDHQCMSFPDLFDGPKVDKNDGIFGGSGDFRQFRACQCVLGGLRESIVTCNVDRMQRAGSKIRAVTGAPQLCF